MSDFLAQLPTAQTLHDEGEFKSLGKSCLIYGIPKSGKTYWLGLLSHHFKLLYFDLESSRETFYSKENKGVFNLPNIFVQPVLDSAHKPLAWSLFMKFFKGENMTMCAKHGLASCKSCGDSKKYSENYVTYNINKIPKDVIVVVDSGSQLDTSIRGHVYGKKDWEKAKATFDEWARVNNTWDIIGTCCQNAAIIPVKLIMTFHQHVDDDKSILPSISTTNYSRTFGKYFSMCIRTKTDNRKFSTSVWSTDDKGVTGNRSGIKTINSVEDWYALWGI
jgi:hypothetical protein